MTHDALRITSPYNGTLLASTVVAGIATAYRGPVRCVPHDPSIREFSISDRGIEVATTFESAEAILTGVARPLPPGNAQYRTGTVLMNEQRQSIEAANGERESSAL